MPGHFRRSDPLVENGETFDRPTVIASGEHRRLACDRGSYATPSGIEPPA
jgi:hypothetical protein